MAKKPRAHQAEAMNFHKQNKRIGTLLWHGMGLGKTLTTLWLAREHINNLKKEGVLSPKFLVILPKSAVPTWKTECSVETPDLLKDMICFPYSQLDKAKNAVKFMDVRMIVFDESHYLKSADTERIHQLSEFLKALGEQGGRFNKGRFLLLSGTPMPNSAAELYTTWALCASRTVVEASERIIDKDRYDKWKLSYTKKKKKTWEARGGEKHGSDFEGVDNLDKLKELITPIIHFRRVEDCIDLPTKEEIHIDLGLDDDKLLKDADIEKPEAYMAVLERLSRAKTPYMIEWVKDYLVSSTQQLVVFSNYVEPIRQLKEKMGNKVLIITGDENDQERAEAIGKFQRGELRVIAMSYKCGSESLNFQNAWVSLYHGYPWTDGMVKQAMARTHRSGQAKRTLHYFLTSGANDSRILRLVRKKEEATNQVENALLESLTINLDSFI